MFCGECGTKNTSGSKFCENCGTELEQANAGLDSTANTGSDNKETQPNQAVNNTIQQFKDDNSQNNQMMNQATPAPAKPMDKKTKLIIGIVVAVVAVLAGGYYYLGTLVTPEKIAENYFNAVIANDADTIYEFMEVEEGKFTTKEMFNKVIENSISEDTKVEVVNYQVGTVSYDDLTKMTATVTVTYVLKDAEKSQTMDIKLSKTKEKKWLFYDNWLVSTAAYTTANDFEIRVQAGSTVKVEGTKLGKSYLNEDSSTKSTDVYVIPTMFTGKYKIAVTLPSGLETEDTVNVSSNSYYYPSISASTLTKNSLNKLESQTLSDLQTFYDNAIAKKTFEEIKSIYEYTDADLTNLETYYTKFVSSLSTTVVLTKIDFTEVEIGSIYTNSDGTFSVSVTSKYDYTVSYQNNGETKTHDDSSSDYATLTYDYVDGNFKLIDANYFETYFSRY